MIIKYASPRITNPITLITSTKHNDLLNYWKKFKSRELLKSTMFTIRLYLWRLVILDYFQKLYLLSLLLLISWKVLLSPVFGKLQGLPICLRCLDRKNSLKLLLIRKLGLLMLLDWIKVKFRFRSLLIFSKILKSIGN